MTETRLTTRLHEEDRAWLKAQAEALGLDNEAGVVRMLIRQARQSGISLNVVMSGIQTPALNRRPSQPISQHGAYTQPSVGEAYAEDVAPVADDVVDDLLTSRLEELAAAPVAAIATVNGEPVGPSAPAVSLRAAPPRAARDYR